MSSELHDPKSESRVLDDALVGGDLVYIRPVRPDDAEWAFEAVAERDEILRWTCWSGPGDEAELRERYSSWRKDGPNGSDYQFAICEVSGDELVGGLTLQFSGHADQGELGYWIGVDRWGRGYAGEALKLISHLAFRRLGTSVLYGRVFVGNEASRRVLEKNGYTLEYTTRASVVRPGQPVEEWYLLQTDSEWQKRRDGWRPTVERVRFGRPDKAGS